LIILFLRTYNVCYSLKSISTYFDAYFSFEFQITGTLYLRKHFYDFSTGNFELLIYHLASAEFFD